MANNVGLLSPNSVSIVDIEPSEEKDASPDEKTPDSLSTSISVTPTPIPFCSLLTSVGKALDIASILVSLVRSSCCNISCKLFLSLLRYPPDEQPTRELSV
eukprot:GHVP01056003.1.p1 GENE.GHVP01056003.1~~GHVP01056003.1.p1  ORF type:complete len:101 (-),score=12.37 GHVP01056003.1:99-401(-)